MDTWRVFSSLHGLAIRYFLYEQLERVSEPDVKE